MYNRKSPHAIIVSDQTNNLEKGDFMFLLIFYLYKNDSIKCSSSLVENLRKEEKDYVKARQFRTS